MIFAPCVDLYGEGSPQNPRTYVGEEIARGNVAQEVLNVPLLPLIDDQYAHFFGGSLVTGVLAAPVFAVMGPTIAALKLVPLGFHLLALVCLVVLLDRYVSRRAAWIGGTLMALTPPGYTQISTIAWGSHMESNALAMLALVLLLDLHARAERTIGRRFAYGLLAGFSIWFGYQCLLFLAVYALFDLARERGRLASRAGAAQALGSVLGLAPWFVYNARNDWAGLSVYGGTLAEHVSAHGPFTRAARLLVELAPRAFFFPPRWGAWAFALDGIGYAALVAAALVCAWRARHVPLELVAALRGRARWDAPPHPAPIALAYLALYFAVFSVSDFEAGAEPEDIRSWRYLMLAYPFLVLAAACGLDALLAARPRRRRIGLSALAVLLALFTAGSLAACDFARWGTDARLPAASMESHGRWLAARYADRLEVLQRIIERASLRRTSEQQEELYTGMGKVLEFMSGPHEDLTPLQEARRAQARTALAFLAAHVPGPYRHAFEARGVAPAREN